MKKTKFHFVGILLLLLNTNVHARPARVKSDYLKVITAFYDRLYSDKIVNKKDCEAFLGIEGLEELEEYLFFKKCKHDKISEQQCIYKHDLYYANPVMPCLYFLEVKQHKEELTQGFSKEVISQLLIDSTKIMDVLGPGSLLIKLTFPNGRFIYFAMAKYADEPGTIGSIWLSNGASLDNKIYPANVQFLSINGAVNDPDGFINVRKGPSNTSPVIGKIIRGKPFSYFPNSESQWLKVVTKDEKIKGYVFYDRVIPLSK